MLGVYEYGHVVCYECVCVLYVCVLYQHVCVLCVLCVYSVLCLHLTAVSSSGGFFWSGTRRAGRCAGPGPAGEEPSVH